MLLTFKKKRIFRNNCFFFLIFKDKFTLSVKDCCRSELTGLKGTPVCMHLDFFLIR
jgi:hypothetical protein